MKSFVTCIVRSGVSVDKLVALIDHCQDSHHYPTQIVLSVYVRNRSRSLFVEAILQNPRNDNMGATQRSRHRQQTGHDRVVYSFRQ